MDLLESFGDLERPEDDSGQVNRWFPRVRGDDDDGQQWNFDLWVSLDLVYSYVSVLLTRPVTKEDHNPVLSEIVDGVPVWRGSINEVLNYVRRGIGSEEGWVVDVRRTSRISSVFINRVYVKGLDPKNRIHPVVLKLDLEFFKIPLVKRRRNFRCLLLHVINGVFFLCIIGPVSKSHRGFSE